MQKKQVTIINIIWEQIPFNGIDFTILNKYCEDSDYGIYQICGHHNAYGRDTLLYIGKAEKQTFGVRLNGRWEFIESCVQPTSIRFGRIAKTKDSNSLNSWTKERFELIINRVEKILIKAHPPAMNKQENAGLFLHENIKEDFLILNWNEYGQLLPEVSTFGCSNFSWNFDTPIKKSDFDN